MKFNFGFGRRFGAGGLTPEQRDVVDRFERGELTAEQAEELLGPGARVRSFGVRVGDAPDERTPPETESAEETRARELVERIAREIDEETRR